MIRSKTAKPSDLQRTGLPLVSQREGIVAQKPAPVETDNSRSYHLAEKLSKSIKLFFVKTQNSYSAKTQLPVLVTSFASIDRNCNMELMICHLKFILSFFFN